MLATGTILCLLHSVAGQDAENNRFSGLEGYIGKSLRYGLTDKLEMAGFSLYDTSNANNSVNVVIIS